MRPRPSVGIGRWISSPTCAPVLWSWASSTVHSASGSSTSLTTFLTMKASNLPVSRSRWERTGSLIRCCFLAAEAMASSSAAIQRSRSISFSRATWRKISFRFSSDVCAWGMSAFFLLPSFLYSVLFTLPIAWYGRPAAVSQLDLQAGQPDVLEPQRQPLGGPGVHQRHCAGVLSAVRRMELRQPRHDGAAARRDAGIGGIGGMGGTGGMGGQRRIDIGAPRQRAEEAPIVARPVELPIEAG